MNIAILDTGAGNLHSLGKALRDHGEVARTTDPAVLCGADLVVLPGVGAFDPAMGHLGTGGARLADALRDGLACIGICLGMQLLFERSEEGDAPGLGVLEGEVRRMQASRTPHMGWSTITDCGEPTITASKLRWGYFAHSYSCPADGAHAVTSTCEVEGVTVPATIRMGRILGVQFHPEKSSAPGVAMLRAYLDEVAR